MSFHSNELIDILNLKLCCIVPSTGSFLWSISIQLLFVFRSYLLRLTFSDGALLLSKHLDLLHIKNP